MEEWRIIESNPNYEVSNTGRVRRIGRDKDHSMTANKRGYLKTDLYSNSIRSVVRVHRLVAETFIPNPDNKPEVNHKDGNKLNNSVENLEWVTKKENCQHAWETGLAKPSYSMRGRSNPNAGRKGKPIRIVETGEVFASSIECEKAIDGNNRHINDCLKGRQNTHRGYHFEYV
jgi:hypothetical protein